MFCYNVMIENDVESLNGGLEYGKHEWLIWKIGRFNGMVLMVDTNKKKNIMDI